MLSSYGYLLTPDFFSLSPFSLSISNSSALLILMLAATLDYLLGDPRGWIHPVQIMGWLISRFSQLVINNCPQKLLRRLAGIILGLGLIISSAIGGYLIVWYANLINDTLGIIIQIILLASCFAGRSLRLAAMDVLQPLNQGNLVLARQKLSQYVGRDTANLDESEILRAVLETVAENTTDGVTAPLFYAILGAFFPGIGSVPLALGYKAASTLDSMIGYRREPYTDLGWFSAQLEDRLTWIPCRLTVLTLALISGKSQRVWAICRRDAIKDPSPNSGWSECTYAAILGVQLGGDNIYGGVIKHKPRLGDRLETITEAKILQALQLSRYCCLIWLSLAIFLLVNLNSTELYSLMSGIGY